MSEQSNNKTIAKNTLFLYVRMMFTMVVSLFTSRVVLNVLGVDDFGIYQTVGGVTMVMSTINGALSTGTSRFLTFELGTGNKEKLRRTFSCTLSIHIFFALLFIIVAETAGLWFVYEKLNIAPQRMEAAVLAYHLSIITAVITITQVPYSASIISHERMSIYAWMSIVDVALKLIAVYALAVSGWDKLKLYAILLCVVQAGIALYYRWYCKRHFEECTYHFVWDRKITRDVLNLSGWNLFANTAIALNTHGTTIIINMFFSPAVVAARAIANQVNMAANQFVQNFRTAVNPQIVKRFAAEDYEGSKSLLLSSTKFSYYLMLLLCLPICLVSEPLLRLWLGQVPPYCVIFLQLTLVTSLFQVFDSSFYTALYAKGRIRENAMLSPTMGFIQFPVVYVLFNMGCSPVAVAWANVVVYALLGLIIKPILIIKIVDYTWSDVLSVFRPCLFVTLLSVPLPLWLYTQLDISNRLFHDILLLVVTFHVTALSIWLFGLDKEMKRKITAFARKKIRM